MKKILIALFLIILPSSVFAQTQITNYPVGTCKQLEGKTGFYQQMSDGTWAAPGDRLNLCISSGFGMTGFNNQFGMPYNSQLGQMTQAQWMSRCLFMNSILPLPECQGYNPFTQGYQNQFPWAGNLLSYPQFGRNYLTMNTGDMWLSVDLSQQDNSNNWSSLLLGVGMGWLLNRITS